MLFQLLVTNRFRTRDKDRTIEFGHYVRQKAILTTSFFSDWKPARRRGQHLAQVAWPDGRMAWMAIRRTTIAWLLAERAEVYLRYKNVTPQPYLPRAMASACIIASGWLPKRCGHSSWFIVGSSGSSFWWLIVGSGGSSLVLVVHLGSWWLIVLVVHHWSCSSWILIGYLGGSLRWLLLFAHYAKDWSHCDHNQRLDRWTLEAIWAHLQEICSFIKRSLFNFGLLRMRCVSNTKGRRRRASWIRSVSFKRVFY